MNKLFRFNFKLDAHDRDCLLWLAARLQRSQSDTVRWLLRNAVAGRVKTVTGDPFGPLPFEPLGITGDWEEWGSGTPDDEGPQ